MIYNNCCQLKLFDSPESKCKFWDFSILTMTSKTAHCKLQLHWKQRRNIQRYLTNRLLNQTHKALCWEQICLNVFCLECKHMCHRQRQEEFLTSRAFTIENIPKNIELKLKRIENNFILTLRYVWYLIRKSHMSQL